MKNKKSLVCYGCGKARPCFVEINKDINDPIEYLRCILDDTNRTGYKWEYYHPTSTKCTKSFKNKMRCGEIG